MTAALAFAPNVGAQTHACPLVGTAGMRLAETEHIVELKIREHRPWGMMSSQQAACCSGPELASTLYRRRFDRPRGHIHVRLALFCGHFWREPMPKREVYSIEIAGLKRELPLFEIKPGLRIALLNILGDTELVQACARELARQLQGMDYDVLVTAEAKSIPLAYALAIETHKPYVVLRKTYKPYMGDALRAETLSITTGQPQILILDEKDREMLRGKRVVILDDVISTGSTLQGMRMIIERAGASVVKEAAILTEGERSKWEQIISLGHLPLFTN